MENVSSKYQYLQHQAEDLKSKWDQYFLQYSGYEQRRDDSGEKFSSISMSELEKEYIHWHGECCGLLKSTSTRWRELFCTGDEEIAECFRNPLLHKDRFTDLINNRVHILVTHSDEREISDTTLRRWGEIFMSEKPLLKVGRLKLTGTAVIAIIMILSLLSSLIFNLLQALVWD